MYRHHYLVMFTDWNMFSSNSICRDIGNIFLIKITYISTLVPTWKFVLFVKVHTPHFFLIWQQYTKKINSLVVTFLNMYILLPKKTSGSIKVYRITIIKIQVRWHVTPFFIGRCKLPPHRAKSSLIISILELMNQLDESHQDFLSSTLEKKHP